jgi:hypothetical protein
MNLEGPINLVGLLRVVFIGYGVEGGFRGVGRHLILTYSPFVFGFYFWIAFFFFFVSLHFFFTLLL